jgi:hypothetical protein
MPTCICTKVETIGDCYVAATGLPDPQLDHALRMTKFARECLFKVPGLLQKLQTTLGPDTLALDMRFGLHSGPVTAGILAGEKSRFQIFGDTVNTAARMESTGQRGKIHVSHPTAELITAGGKGRWLTPRDELVEAKGKGLMKTYWVTLVGEHKKKKVPRSSSLSTESETGQSSASNSIDHFNNSSTTCFSETGCMSDSGNSSGMDFSVDTTSDVVDWTSASKPPQERSYGGRTSILEPSPSLRRGVTEHSPATVSSPTPSGKRERSFGSRISLEQGVSPRRGSTEHSAALVSSPDPSEKYARHIDLLYDVTSSYLKRIAAGRSNNKSDGSPITTTSLKNAIVRRRTVLDEVSDFIPMPLVGSSGRSNDQSCLKLALGRLPGKVEAQWKDFITTIVACHRENNQFHNFERTAHMVISSHKMIGRICKTEPMHNVQQGGAHWGTLSFDGTEDIWFDPLLQFAVVFAALIRNVDHAGINNEALCKENPQLAAICVGCSIAEQNAVEIGWELLMDPSYTDLQHYMFGSIKSEILRFRQVVVNMVMATDIFNVRMRENRNKRWHKAFHNMTEDSSSNNNNRISRSNDDNKQKKKKSFRIAVVMEHIIQAVDMAHMVQGWNICKKWNIQSFHETYQGTFLPQYPRSNAFGATRC